MGETYQLGDLTLDPRRGVNDPATRTTILGPLPTQLLIALAEKMGDVVEWAALASVLAGEPVVSRDVVDDYKDTLYHHISSIRQFLNERVQRRYVVETVAGFGYCMQPRGGTVNSEIGDARRSSIVGDSDESASGAASPTSYLESLRAALRRWGAVPYATNLEFTRVWELARLAPLNRQRPDSPEGSLAMVAGYWLEEFRDQAMEEEAGSPWAVLRKRIRRGVIVAGAGLGKTTLLLAEANQLVVEALASPELDAEAGSVPELPVLARLDDIADGLRRGVDVFEAISRAAVAGGAFLDDALRRERVVLLLDGLDEIPRGSTAGVSSPRDLVEDALASLIEEHDERVRMIVTSRIQGYRPPWPMRMSLAEAELELLPLRTDGALATLKEWLGDSPTLADAAERYLRASPSLSALSRTPLFLTFIYSLVRGSSESGLHRLPQSRAELYEGMVTELMRAQWRPREMQRMDTPGALEQALRVVEGAALTLANDEQGWPSQFSADRLFAALGSEPSESMDDFILRAGIVTSPFHPSWGEAATYTFVHRSIQEYLVARALSHRRNEDAIDVVRPHLWFEPEWEQVLVFLVARSSNPELWLRLLLAEPDDAFHQMTILAGRCIAESGTKSIARETVIDVATRLARPLLSHSLLEQKRAARVGGVLPTVGMTRLVLRFQGASEIGRGFAELLDQLRFPGALPELLIAASARDAGQRTAAARALRSQADEAATETLIRLLWDEDPSVACAAAESLGHHRSDVVFNELVKMISDDGWDARYREVPKIRRGRLAREVVLAAAKSAGLQAGSRVDELVRLLDETNGDEGEFVVEALSQCRDDRATEALLRAVCRADGLIRERAMNGLKSRRVEGELRSEAIRSLAEAVTRADSRGRIELLILLASLTAEMPPDLVHVLLTQKSEPAAGTRERLATALAEAATDTQLLLVSYSNVSWARTLAAGAIGQRGTAGVARVRSTLLSPEDEYWVTRETAARALASVRSPAARRALETALRSDPGATTREACAESLAKHGHLASVPPLIAAMQDVREDSRVRSAAAVALGIIGGETAVEAVSGQGVEGLNVWDTATDVLAARLARGDLAALDVLIAISGSDRLPDSLQAYAALSRVGPTLAARPDWPQIRQEIAAVTASFVYSEEWAKRMEREERRRALAERDRVEDDAAPRAATVSDEPDTRDGLRRYTTGMSGGDDWSGVMNRIERRRETAIVRRLRERDWEVWIEGRVIAPFEDEEEAMRMAERSAPA